MVELITVNKARYRKHLNIVIVSSIIVFAGLSLGVAQLLIALYPDADGSHFHWNVTGVIIGAISVGITLRQFSTHPFMTEVLYVWRLKQALNLITRKLRQLKHAANEGNVSAMQALQYSYSGSRLLWELDDNTIVMDDLAIAQAELDTLASQHNVTLDPKQYDPAVLKQV